MGDVANSSMKATSQATDKVVTSFDKINQVTQVSRGYLKGMGVTAKSSFATLSNAQKRALLDLNNLNQKCSSTREELNTIGVTGYNAFLQLSNSSQKALTSWNSMSQSTLKWTDHVKLAQIYTKGFGVDIDSTKGKILVLGNTIQSSLSSKFESLKTKVTGVAGIIKNSLSNALTTVKGKVETVANSFNGLGGVIASAIGALGMNGIKDLTIGLAMTREQMTTLTSATWGNAKAAQSFVKYMDEMTNNSLVSLNDLGQAMNTIKMSTGMSNEQLKNFTTVVNDVGQRAILMGKDSTEAMSLMQAAGRGLNGEFDILKSNFGITKDQLQKLGWKGTAQDIEGYQKALEKALSAGGSMDGMMNTLSGQIQLVKKGFTSAGRQIGEMFVPYIKEAVNFMLNLKQECPDVYKYLIAIAGAVSGFATIAPSLSPILQTMSYLNSGLTGMVGKITALAGSTSSATKIIQSSMVEVYNAEKGVYEMQSVLGPATKAFYTALAEGEGILVAIKAGYAEMAIAEYIALGPLLAIIGAIALLGVAVYELGKYFGWWKDLPSMFGAISSGVQRLWSAFVNNQYVQEAIKAVSSAFEWLGEVLTPVGQWFMDVLGIVQPAGEEFDIVRAIIDVLGASFDLLVQNLTSVYNAFMFVVGCVQNTISFFQWLYTTLINAPTYLSQFISMVNDWFSQLPSKVYSYISLTLVKLIIGLTNWVISGKNKAKLMVNGIINFIKTLPGKVYSYIINTASRIISGVNNWVSNARSGASKVVSGVIGFISSIPGKVGNEFSKIPGRILNGLNAAVSAAGRWGQSVLNAAMNALGIHSPGYIQRNVVTEFENTTKQILNQVSSAKKAGTAFGESIVEGYDSNFDLDLKNQDLSKNTKVTVEEKLAIILDFVNVPSNASTSDLANLVNDDKFVTAIAENAKFQKVDSMMKSRLNRKNIRSGGI